MNIAPFNNAFMNYVCANSYLLEVRIIKMTVESPCTPPVPLELERAPVPVRELQVAVPWRFQERHNSIIV